MTELLNLCVMKLILFSTVTIFLFSAVFAQPDSWKVYLNKKLLIDAGREAEIKNTKTIERSELDKPGELIVTYTEGNPNNEWKRTIAIMDENDNNLFEKDEIDKIQVSTMDLKKLAVGKAKLKIYTWAIPKDPAKAALIRIRRVHLCTLVLK